MLCCELACWPGGATFSLATAFAFPMMYVQKMAVVGEVVGEESLEVRMMSKGMMLLKGVPVMVLSEGALANPASTRQRFGVLVVGRRLAVDAGKENVVHVLVIYHGRIRGKKTGGRMIARHLRTEDGEREKILVAH